MVRNIYPSTLHVICDKMPSDMVEYRIDKLISASEGCFLCRILEESERSLYDEYLTDEVVMDADFRGKLADELSYCPRHMKGLFVTSRKAQSEDGLGLALMLSTLLRSFSERSARLTDARKGKARDRSLSGAASIFQRKCPICMRLAETEKIYSRSSLSMLSEGKDEIALHLCLEHAVFCMMIASRERRDRAFTLLAEGIERTAADALAMLSEFIGKHDYRRTDEKMGEEVHANEFAIQLISRRSSILIRP